jgi:starch phosphorylase
MQIKKIIVNPYLPQKLAPLMTIARNLWWVWNFEAIDLFRRLDVDLWRECGHNPIAFLGALPQEQLNEAAESESFIAHMERVVRELDWHMTKKLWFDDMHAEYQGMTVAYFSAEFGIHECLPIYSGGLGILAGDHLKSASELGIPLVGVGLMYRFGYFHQYLTIDGWQQERYPETDIHNTPISPMLDSDGSDLIVSVEYATRTVRARVWQAHVGRIILYLLDTNIEENTKDDRSITDYLYGGDNEMRVKQEILLGIGGYKALKKMGIPVTAYHMNEGHSAFLSIERIADAMREHKLSFDAAKEFVTASTVFTTHTPVPAGNDRFDPVMIDRYFKPYYQALGLSKDEFLALGRENPDDEEELFCMTVLAIKTAAFCNGVSKLHGRVSREMWKKIWPDLPAPDVPIGHITNGIQTLAWTSDEMMRLFNRYLGPRWIDNPVDRDIWKGVDSIPASELWRCRERLRERLVGFSRRKLRHQLAARGLPPHEVEAAEFVLDSEALTIGFARRFATYKRATLIMRDMARLERILLDHDKPVQLVFAGKAHPKDEEGKEFIRHIVNLVRDERFRNKVVFLEDYDINVARYLVQGVDVWLNNPIRPKEASGTSGMKVIPNGGLNLSVLDGWWDEGYDHGVRNGWAIGQGEEYDDRDYQDHIESLGLYNILEQEVIPLFYRKGVDGVPREWVDLIKNSMKSLCPEFNTNRMVLQYAENFYMRAHERSIRFSGNGYQAAQELSAWKKNIVKKWTGVSIREFSLAEDRQPTVGEKVRVRTDVVLGGISPEDVLVEVYFGNLNPDGQIVEGAALPLSLVSKMDDNCYRFEGQMLCLRTGQFGYTARVVPSHDLMTRKYEPGLVVWA